MKSPRLLIVGLDGYPCSLLRDPTPITRMPSLERSFSRNAPRLMTTVIPPLSSVAWASFMTGTNPGNHGVFGFIDHDRNSRALYLPNHNHLKKVPFWSALSTHGVRPVVINVPMSYPPRAVNGVVIGGFLGTDINKIAYPASISTLLKDTGYIIDVDSSIRVTSGDEAFIQALIDAMDKRFTLFFRFLDEKTFDFLQLHIMETDRLFHFFWPALFESKSTRMERLLQSFFLKLDDWLRQLMDRMRSSDELILLSDHGFCEAQWELQINQLLADEGLLSWATNRSEDLELTAVGQDSRLFSLLPGRIYIMDPDAPDSRRQEIQDRLTALCGALLIPGTSTPAIQAVYSRSELFQGDQCGNAPDFVLLPVNGVELKGKLAPCERWTPSRLSGMHTYDDAFVWALRRPVSAENPKIIDIYRAILEFYDIESEGFEGGNIFRSEQHLEIEGV